MDSEKRKERKAAKQRRRQELIRRHVKPTATVSTYGRDGEVEHLGVVIHRGSEILATHVFHSRDFACGEALVTAGMASVWPHKVAKVYFVGNRLADLKGRS